MRSEVIKMDISVDSKIALAKSKSINKITLNISIFQSISFLKIEAGFHIPGFLKIIRARFLNTLTLNAEI